jgi:hypothetical protein
VHCMAGHTKHRCIGVLLSGSRSNVLYRYDYGFLTPHLVFQHPGVVSAVKSSSSQLFDLSAFPVPMFTSIFANLLTLPGSNGREHEHELICIRSAEEM